MAGLMKVQFKLFNSIKDWITDPNLKNMIETGKVRINFKNGIETGMIVEIRVLFNFLEKESYYRISWCLKYRNTMKG